MRCNVIAMFSLLGTLTVFDCATSGDRFPDALRETTEGGSQSSSGGSTDARSDGVGPSADASLFTDENAERTSSIRDSQSEFSTTCGVCESGQTCAPGYAGTYCVVPCPGQPCPGSGPRVPYCDTFGGVHCLSQ